MYSDPGQKLAEDRHNLQVEVAALRARASEYRELLEAAHAACIQSAYDTDEPEDECYYRNLAARIRAALDKETK